MDLVISSLGMSNFFTSETNLEYYENEEIEADYRFLLHMDIDYFYAQVELLDKSQLKGLPLIVGNPNARQTGRGVVLTCTYEAREFGIRSGMSMAEALRRCPEVEIVKPRYGGYSKISKRIMNILASYQLPLRKAGSDEAYMDITGAIDLTADHYEQAYAFAIQLKKKILEQEQLTVSVGIGPTLKLAKIASEHNKPDGITIVLPETLDSFLEDIKLVKIPGIGPKTGERLKERGYEKCGQLMYQPKDELVRLLGSWGEYLFRVFRGETTNKILPRGERKSISHERTFVGKPHEIEKYQKIVQQLFDKTYEGLVKSQYYTRTVDVKIRFNGYKTLTRSKSLSAITQSRDLLFSTVLEIVTPHLNDDRGLRLLGVGFSNLEKLDDEQMNLDDWFEYDRETSLDHLPEFFREEVREEDEKETDKTLDEWF